MKRSKIIIIGFGPAGIACAIQLRRMGLHPLVIEKDLPGGMLPNANLVENYPGFPNGISGDKLAELFIRQAERFHIGVSKDEITSIENHEPVFYLQGKTKNYECEKLILATGTIPYIPEGIPDDLIGKGLIHSDIQRLKNLSGMTIGIIGAGDAAFDYSLSLAEKGNQVMIFNRGNVIKALKVLSEKVFINNSIKYYENHRLDSLELSESKSLTAFFNSTSSNSKYSLDYLIFATGRTPSTGFFPDHPAGLHDSLVQQHRLYLIGDLKNGICRQVSAAVGDGVRAAMEIFHDESHQ